MQGHVPLQLDVSTVQEVQGVYAPLRGQSVMQCVFTACESVPSRKRSPPTHHAEMPDFAIFKHFLS